MSRPNTTLALLLASWLVAGCGNDGRVLATSTHPELPGDAGVQHADAGADARAPADPGCIRNDGEPGLAYDREGCQVSELAPTGYCGDGQVQSPEECDDGNTLDDDGCSSACQLRVCGNGRVDPGETCDLIGPSCSSACQLIPPPAPAACGNGTREGQEECDDGNVQDGDGCSGLCLTEACGNQRLDAGETCDPPDGAACDAQCQTIRCGDGRKSGTEQCDDGNRDDGDGCDASCKREGCGNEILEPGEDCEPPGTAKCDAQCHALRVECGNRKLEAGEECDDGNGVFGDGCSPTCQKEKCGNDRVEAPAEECEPPGSLGCTTQCRRPRCGDGELSKPEEECEDGNSDNGDGCSADCHWEVCGNGKLEVPEECEPSLSSNCSPSCKLQGASEWVVPVDGAAFNLLNAGFDDRTLVGWTQIEPSATSIDYSSLDANGSPGSGSVQIGPSSSLQQCVRTAEGAQYRLAAHARLQPGQETPAALDLGVRFYAGTACSGAVLDGLVTSSFVAAENGDWSVASLPPESFDTTLIAPEGAGSMMVWFEVVPDGDAAPSLLVDEVELVRVDPSCGDGVPDSDEECEPGVTSGCRQDCTLPRECGDHIPAPGECSGAGACTEDCLLPALCGDGKVTAPEECDPPSDGLCTAHCTIQHGFCGDRKQQGGEECDPPNGTTCGLDCQAIACGNNKIEAPETCDPPGPNCTKNCRLKREQPSVCGNGLLEGAEQCDPPNLATWCTSTCQRRDPAEACGDGQIDSDLGEECDPPGFAANCGSDCRLPRCGDGKVSGSEECEPGLVQPENCGQDCRYRDASARSCVDCLSTSCGAPAADAEGDAGGSDAFEGCFALKGVAQAGPAKGVLLSQLCIEAVECMRQTDCAVEYGANADPMACYCGKEVVLDGSAIDTLREQARKRTALLACRDGSEPAHGACRDVIARAAEATGPGLAVAAFDNRFGRPAVLAAVRLMTQCGQKDGGACKAACSVTPSCGNGMTEAGEACDPRDPSWGAKCSTLCTLLPCGNGTVDEGETCDVADPYTNIDGSCTDSCQLKTVCGDGRLIAAVEACDPGPNGSWDECCRPDTIGDAEQRKAQLEACDKDKDGKISGAESCRVPSICGNSKLEGLEQCDPPTTGKCNDKCETIAPETPCDICAKEFCQGQSTACFNSGVPSFDAACRKVSNCIDDTKCAPDGNVLSCLCGDLIGQACYVPQPPGACAQDFLKGGESSCPDHTPACLVPVLLNPVHPTGAAAQWMQCKADYCFEQCYGAGG